MFPLKDVHEVYRKWLHIEDTKRIDVMLAVALSRKLPGKTRLWLIFVGNSGDGKSEQLDALDDSDLGDAATTKVIHRFTPRTLVSGQKTFREIGYDRQSDQVIRVRADVDLAPKLKGKIIIIKDMAQLLTLHPNEKAEVWAQLRELYDGNAGVQTGTGKDIEYRDLDVTLIAGATPAIDDQILIHQSLGTRELLYRTKEQNTNSLMQKVWENEENEVRMKKELKLVTREFLKSREIKDIKIPETVEEQLKFLSKYLSILRATASIDSYTGETRNIVYPEKPTRCLKQLKRLYISLKSLDDDYTDADALAVVTEVVESSILPVRKCVLKELIASGSEEITEYELSKRLRLGRKTVYSELCILWNMGLVTMKEEETTDYYGHIRGSKKLWALNKSHEIIQKMIPVKNEGIQKTLS